VRYRDLVERLKRKGPEAIYEDILRA